MIHKSTQKIVFQSRKKAISGQRKLPMNNTRKIVWSINLQGSTFLVIDKETQFEGDEQVKNIMFETVIPEINKTIGKLWLKDLQKSSRSDVFPVINTLIKVLLFFLMVCCITVLLVSDSSETIYSNILVFCVYLVWFVCTLITAYTFLKKNQDHNYEKQIIQAIRTKLYEYNQSFLKERGYVAKCDEWGIWISVGPNRIPSTDQDLIH